jgi:3-deoxy-D-manno-octulosonic-acid transferase
MVHLNKVLEHIKKLLLISIEHEILPVSLVESPSEEIYKHHRNGRIAQHSKISDLLRNIGVKSEGQIAQGDEISHQLRGLIIT